MGKHFHHLMCVCVCVFVCVCVCVCEGVFMCAFVDVAGGGGGESTEESVYWLNRVITLDFILITPISSSHYTKIDVRSTLQLPDTPKGGHLQLTEKILCTGIDFPLHRLSKKRTPLISGQNFLHRRCPLIGESTVLCFISSDKMSPCGSTDFSKFRPMTSYK